MHSVGFRTRAPLRSAFPRPAPLACRPAASGSQLPPPEQGVSLTSLQRCEVIGGSFIAAPQQGSVTWSVVQPGSTSRCKSISDDLGVLVSRLQAGGRVEDCDGKEMGATELSIRRSTC